MSDETELKTRLEAAAKIPQEQRFQLRLVPAPGRLFFASTIGNALCALEGMFKGLHSEGEAVCLLDAKFEEDGGFLMDVTVLPVRDPRAAEHKSNASPTQQDRREA